MSGGTEEDEIVHSGTLLGDKLIFCDQLTRATMKPLRETWKKLECDY